tara:strand:- start:808 stop:957 length:150 start_codon:yes stop_codon:yes gene_type:complete
VLIDKKLWRYNAKGRIMLCSSMFCYPLKIEQSITLRPWLLNYQLDHSAS